MRRNLTPLEARIVAVLVEKEATVRDSYPLSLNALCAGCNQKTAREPVMTLGDAEVLATIEELKTLNLVNEVSGARVVRYEHNLARVLGVPGAAAALLTLLVLRGPQTAAELRLHCERLHRFADVSSVEGFLDELAEKSPSRVRKLPRVAGARESRWVHLLCGDAGLESLASESASASTSDAGLAEDVAVLRAEVAELRGQLGRLAAALGADLG